VSRKGHRFYKQETNLPAEKYPDLLLRFHDTYTYYSRPTNLVAFCSSCPAPWKVLIRRMTITLQNDNHVIVYALEKVISKARKTQQILAADCIWWLASVIGLEQGFIIYIDNLQKRFEISHDKAALVSETRIPQEVTATSNIHPA